MKEFKDKVAVITGAASGIGRALAERCAEEGMKVVLADIEEEALLKAEEGMKASGATALSVLTDVSKYNDVESLAQKTINTFGAVHLLFNNTGVSGGKTVWESTISDWKWIMGVNLWGVIHGIRVFVPIMLEKNDECHIVNTASMAGLVSSPSLGIYKVTKAGIITISETLHHELKQRGAKINVSVLCPGWVSTRVSDSVRNRPVELLNDTFEVNTNLKHEAVLKELRSAVKYGMSLKEVADCVFNGIKEKRLYIFTHPDWKILVKTRMKNILNDFD